MSEIENPGVTEEEIQSDMIDLKSLSSEYDLKFAKSRIPRHDCENADDWTSCRPTES